MSTRIGTFAVGFDRYWPQFPGLREQLEGYLREFEAWLGDVEVVSAGMVDDVASGRRAGDLFAQRQADLVFCDVTTYIPSASVLPVLQRAKAPVVLAGLQPSPGLNPATATMRDQLAHDNCTNLPELVFAAQRSRTPVAGVLFGMLHGDERVRAKIRDWVDAAKAAHALRNGRIGFLGHAFEGMVDMYADPGLVEAAFGLHMEMIEMCELKKFIDSVTERETEAMMAQIRDYFVFPEPGVDPIAGPVRPESLAWSARVAVGLERLVAGAGLDGLAYYYRGLDDNEFQRIVPAMIVGNSLLTGRGVPIAGEGDIKNCIAMLVMDRLGAGGSFAELHPASFAGDFVLVGHDGPGHIAISGEKPALRDLSVLHGKYGKGISVEFKVKNGPITLLGLTHRPDGAFKFVVAEGESVPGDIPATGNTNTPARFAPDVATFVEDWSKAGPTHHFALGVGRQAGRIEKVGRLMNIDVEVVAQ
ncbi:MAG: L-fucose/L-arabinose isomerase family protein [Acidobacteria bacterium]|nr:L-fucose/L-arabinose isomerase family protein [Acidobacteriota bacterium]